MADDEKKDDGKNDSGEELCANGYPISDCDRCNGCNVDNNKDKDSF